MSVGYLFSGVLGHLPLLAVLIAGFVLVASRSRRLGPRSVLFARLGLGALTLGIVLQIALTLLIPLLYSRLDYSVTRYSLLFGAIGLVTSLVTAAGIGLLIAAVVTRGPAGPGEEGQPFGAGPTQAYDGVPTYPAPMPYSGGSAFGGAPGSEGQPFSAGPPHAENGPGDQATRPPPTG